MRVCRALSARSKRVAREFLTPSRSVSRGGAGASSQYSRVGRKKEDSVNNTNVGQTIFQGILPHPGDVTAYTITDMIIDHSLPDSRIPPKFPDSTLPICHKKNIIIRTPVKMSQNTSNPRLRLPVSITTLRIPT